MNGTRNLKKSASKLRGYESQMGTLNSGRKFQGKELQGTWVEARLGIKMEADRVSGR